MDHLTANEKTESKREVEQKGSALSLSSSWIDLMKENSNRCEGPKKGESSLPELAIGSAKDEPAKNANKVQVDQLKTTQDASNNQQTTAQKAADKVDAYIRS